MLMVIVTANFLFFNLLYLISVKKKDFGIIDVGWGMSFILIFMAGVLSTGLDLNWRGVLLGTFVILWGVRLSGYLLKRLLKKNKEDFRYANWRKEWGENANKIAYFKVFMLQAILSLLIASPLIVYINYTNIESEFYWNDTLGILLWVIGFLFQSIGDYQKNKFKSLPENSQKICTIGLWRWSRHPNYFGEASMWWGIFFLIISEVPFYYAIWGALLINFLLLKVSGVPLLEESYQNRPGFKEYQQSTNKFIPWFPRKEHL